MIYLNPTIDQESSKQVLDDDNVWRWFKRELKGSWWRGEDFSDGVLINNSKHSLNSYPDNVVNYHLELVIEILEKCTKPAPHYDPKIWKGSDSEILKTCKNSKITVIPSKLMYKPYKERCRSLEVIPIGLNTDIWKPLDIDKKTLRAKYNLPENKTVGFWSGNAGIWRGPDLLNEYARGKDIHWIINWYRGPEFDMPTSRTEVFKADQKTINELYNASDFYLCTNKLGPYYMSDWEAIASGVDIIDVVEMERELGTNPTRDKMMALGWDRKDAINIWNSFLNENYNI
jgi:hypothetical protein